MGRSVYVNLMNNAKDTTGFTLRVVWFDKNDDVISTATKSGQLGAGVNDIFEVFGIGQEIVVNATRYQVEVNPYDVNALW